MQLLPAIRVWTAPLPFNIHLRKKKKKKTPLSLSLPLSSYLRCYGKFGLQEEEVLWEAYHEKEI